VSRVSCCECRSLGAELPSCACVCHGSPEIQPYTPRDATEARVLTERVRRLARSPGAVLDGYDLRALRWGATLCAEATARMEAEARERRSEDDTAKIGR
jgi:hypothetical protein